MSVFGYSSPVNRRPFSFISDLDVRNSHVRLASTRQYRRLDQSHPKGAKQEHFLKTSDDKTTPTRSFSIRSTKRTFLSGISKIDDGITVVDTRAQLAIATAAR